MSSTLIAEEERNDIAEDSVSYSSKLSKTSEALEEMDPDAAIDNCSNTTTVSQ